MKKRSLVDESTSFNQCLQVREDEKYEVGYHSAILIADVDESIHKQRTEHETE